MPLKINILRLEKTHEYVKKEIDTAIAIKYKLLKDSDWTQCVDSGLRVHNLLEWRIWRHNVREISRTLELSELINVLDTIQDNMPSVLKRTNEPFKFILNDFNYGSLDLFKQSCIIIAMELYPNKKLLYDGLQCKLSTTNDIPTSFNRLVEIIQHGY